VNFKSDKQRKAVMAKLKEYRVFDKNYPYSQGHYIVTDSKKKAIKLVEDDRPYLKGELDAVVWKIKSKGSPYPNKQVGDMDKYKKVR